MKFDLLEDGLGEVWTLIREGDEDSVVHSPYIVTDGVIVQVEDLLLISIELDQSFAAVPVALQNATDLKKRQKEYSDICSRLIYKSDKASF